jgi:hypothetical protein
MSKYVYHCPRWSAPIGEVALLENVGEKRVREWELWLKRDPNWKLPPTGPKKGNNRKVEREKEIRRAREKGMTLHDIAILHGISRARVGQILKRDEPLGTEMPFAWRRIKRDLLPNDIAYKILSLEYGP